MDFSIDFDNLTAFDLQHLGYDALDPECEYEINLEDEQELTEWLLALIGEAQ